MGWAAAGVPRWVSQQLQQACIPATPQLRRVHGFLECHTHCLSPCSDSCWQGSEKPPMLRNCQGEIYNYSVSRTLASLSSRSPDLQLWWFLFGDAQHLVGRFRLAGDPTQSIQMLSSHAASTTYQFYSPWELRAQTVITSCQIGFYTSYKVMF